MLHPGFTSILLIVITVTPLAALEIGGWVAVQGQVFAEEGADGQEQWNISLATQPEFYHGFDDGVWSILAEPFARLDAQDEERTHLDLREAHALAVFDSLEFKIGISREFWGATEFRHLVDIVNQTDQVENIDSEDKLGQPMIKGTWFGDWGSVEFFVLTGFRERTFAGADGRLRSPLVVDTDAARYESGAEQAHIDVAGRFATTIGPIDLGIGAFAGTNRDPLLLTDPAGDRLIPFYEQILQGSVDATMVTGQALWKLEALVRDSERERYASITGGTEYTLVGVFGSRQDLGLLLEYIWDERGDEAPVQFQDDIALGLRWVFNDFDDSELLLGLIRDTAGGGQVLTAEYERRLGDRWSLEVQARIFADTRSDPALAAVDSDDHLQVELFHHF